MTDDQIRAAIERVRANGMFSDGVDVRAICDFAAARLAEPAKGEPLSDAPCKVCGYNGPGYYQPETHPCAGQPAPPVAPFADTTGVPVCPQCGGSKRIPRAGLTAETAWEECRACKPVAPEPPAELVETVAMTDCLAANGLHWDAASPQIKDLGRQRASAILAALAGSIVQPGMVAVPVEDLRLAISNDGYEGSVPYFNALLRLHERLRAAGGGT